ncbi:MAG: PilZ domain-containing protein [Magnetococcales bacterium]|nr:PilZ domain-containing protein [Magnetococcales bacterium]
MKQVEPICGRVTDQTTIISMILHACDETQQIRLHMDQQFLEYITHFKTGPEPDKFLYLYIGGLVPPVGNIKIRKSHVIEITFQTNTRVVETKVRFLRAVTNELFRLSFPKYVKIMAQKRSAIRVAPVAAMKISLGIIRPDGLELPAQIVDISAEGLSFLFEKSEYYLPKEASIQIVLSWGGGCHHTIVDAQVVGHVTRDLVEGHRAKFVFSTVEQSMRIGELVASIQCDILQHRVQVSSEEKIKTWEVKPLAKVDIPTSSLEDWHDRYYSQWMDKSYFVAWTGNILGMCAGFLIALNLYIHWAYPLLIVASLVMGVGLSARHRSLPLLLIGFILLLGVIGTLRVWW